MTNPYQPFLSAHTQRWLLCLAMTTATLGFGTAAQAQVVRCTDAKTGHITYTNGSCIGGEATVQVQQAQSREEIAQERSQAASAIARTRAEIAEDEKARLRREDRERKEYEALQRAQARNNAQRGGETAACQQAKRNYNNVLAEANPDPSTWGNRSLAAQRQMEMECLGASAYQQLEQTRALQPNAINRIWYGANGRPVQPSQPVPAMTNCNVFRCFDAKGNAHTRPWP